MKKTVLLNLLMLVTTPCYSAPLDKDAFDTISIRADEAVEDEQPGILHLKGNFLMQSSEWHLSSEMATVYGSPNNPDKIYLEGSPARFLIKPIGEQERESIEATALMVEYLREDNRLTMTGEATLILGNEVIQSTYIEYDINSNRYQAGGKDGVSIKVPPGDYHR